MDHSQPTPPLDIEALLREESWIRRIAGDLVQDAARADDITQDVLSAALKQRPRVRGSQLRAWLRTVTRRAAGAERRLEERRGHAENEAFRRKQDAADASSRLELHRRLHDALEALPEIDRTALVLRYLHELSPAQLAARLGIPETAARKRVSRGLAHLRERLDRDCGDRRAWAAPLALLVPDVEHVPPGLGPVSTLVSLVTMKKALAAVLVVVGLALVVQRVTSERDLASNSARAAVAAPMLDGAQVARERTMASAANPAANVDERHEVRGQTGPLAPDEPRLVVVDPDGKPAVDAVAAWIDARGEINEITVGSDGSALLPTEFLRQHFLATAPGFAAASAHPYADDPLPLVLQLEHTVTLRGRVLVDGEAPSDPIHLACESGTAHLLPGVVVSRETKRKLQGIGLLAEKGWTLTGARGEFRFPGQHPLEAGSVELPISFDRGGDWRNNHASYKSPTEPLSIEVTRDPYLFGRVVWAHDGLPVTGQTSEIRWNSDGSKGHGTGSTISPTGRFEVALYDLDDVAYVRGIVELSFRPANGTPRNHGFKYDVETRNSPIDVGTITLEKPTPATIRVIDSQGDPIAGASVYGVSSYTKPAADKEQTEQDGLITVVTDREDTLAIFCPDYTCFQSPLNALPLGPDGVLVAKLSRGARLRVTTPTVTRFSSGNRVGRIEVICANPTSAHLLILPVGVLRGAFVRRPSLRFGANPTVGTAVFPLAGEPLDIGGLEPGSHYVVSLDTGTGERIAEQRVTLPLEPGVFDVVLLPEEIDRNSLAVTLPDLTPRHAAGVSVRLLSTSGTSCEGFRDGDGWYFDPVGRDVHTLEVECASFVMHRQDVQLSGEHRQLAITLQPAREIRVDLQAADDEHALPDSIHMESAGGWRSRSWKPKQAESRPFTGVPLGPVTVIAVYGEAEVLTPILAGDDSVTIRAPE